MPLQYPLASHRLPQILGNLVTQFDSPLRPLLQNLLQTKTTIQPHITTLGRWATRSDSPHLPLGIQKPLLRTFHPPTSLPPNQTPRQPRPASSPNPKPPSSQSTIRYPVPSTISPRLQALHHGLTSSTKPPAPKPSHPSESAPPHPRSTPGPSGSSQVNIPSHTRTPTILYLSIWSGPSWLEQTLERQSVLSSSQRKT